MLNMDSFSKVSKDELICFALENLDVLTDMASNKVKFKNLHEIELLNILVDTCIENKANIIKLDDNSEFTVNCQSFYAAKIFNEGKKLGLKHRKLTEHVNIGLNKSRKEALELLKDLESLNLISRQTNI